MTITTEPLGSGKSIIWYYNKPNEKQGKRSGELYRTCTISGKKWAFLDSYIDSSGDSPNLEHTVITDKAILTIDDQAPRVMSEIPGFDECAKQGQPYLTAPENGHRYRLRIWGHLAERTTLKWYWDASVSLERVRNDCMNPIASAHAIKVEEAWWSTFKDAGGAWGLGSGTLDPANGAPDGVSIKYGRTVWHGENQIPYFPAGRKRGDAPPKWCVPEVKQSSQLR